MSEDVRKKIEEFAKRMETDEDIFKLLDEMNTYLEGISDSSNNPYTKSQLGGLMMDFSIFRVVLAGFKTAGERMTKMQTELNNALGRISQLEKKRPLDDPEPLK